MSRAYNIQYDGSTTEFNVSSSAVRCLPVGNVLRMSNCVIINIRSTPEAVPSSAIVTPGFKGVTWPGFRGVTWPGFRGVTWPGFRGVTWPGFREGVTWPGFKK